MLILQSARGRLCMNEIEKVFMIGHKDWSYCNNKNWENQKDWGFLDAWDHSKNQTKQEQIVQILLIENLT